MAHRTLNETTAFYGDMREHHHRNRMSRKQALSVDAWAIAYPGERMPYRACDVYADLRSAGFEWDGAAWVRPTPVAPDRAEARDGDVEGETRAAGEHDG